MRRSKTKEKKEEGRERPRRREQIGSALASSTSPLRSLSSPSYEMEGLRRERLARRNCVESSERERKIKVGNEARRKQERQSSFGHSSEKKKKTRRRRDAARASAAHVVVAAAFLLVPAVCMLSSVALAADLTTVSLPGERLPLAKVADDKIPIPAPMTGALAPNKDLQAATPALEQILGCSE